MNASASQTDAGMPANQHGAFRLLFFCLISVGMGQSLMFAVLPPVARNMGLSELQVGAIFAISAVLWVLASPMWGRRSDYWGRRPVIITGLSGYAVSMLAFGLCVQAGLSGWLALWPAYLLMILSRSIFGAFGSATMPAAQAYIADRTPPADRAARLTILGAAFGLGVTLGPGIVALLLPLGLMVPFYAVGILGALSALVARLRLPEAFLPKAHAGSTRRIRILDSRILPFLLVGIIMAISQASTMQTAGFYAIDMLGMEVAQSARFVGLALMGTAACALFAQLVIVRMLRPLPRTMMGCGAFCGLLAFAVLVAGDSTVTMFIALMALGFTFGLTQPGAIAGASLSAGADQQGAVTGLMNTTGAIGVIFAPFVGMPLYQWLPQAPYMLNMGLASIALVFVLLHPRIRAARPGAAS